MTISSDLTLTEAAPPRYASETVPRPEHFVSASYRAARELVVGAILREQRYIAITGENGVGKTAVVEAVIASFRNSPLGFIRVGNRLPVLLTIERLLDQFGAGIPAATGEDTLAHALRSLVARADGKPRLVLVIEEAETLEPKALSLLEILPTLASPELPNLQLLFVGGPAFWALLDDEKFRGLRAQLTTPARLERLTGQEVGSYVMHRLVHAAGWPDDTPLDPALLDAAEAGEGNPSRINALLDQALLAYEEQQAEEEGPVEDVQPEAGPPPDTAVRPSRSRWFGLVAGLVAVAAILFVTGRVFYRGIPRQFATDAVHESAPGPGAGAVPAAVATQAPPSAPSRSQATPAPSAPAPAPPVLLPSGAPAAPSVAPEASPDRAAADAGPPPASTPPVSPPAPRRPAPLRPAAEATLPTDITPAALPDAKAGLLADRRVVIHYRAGSAEGEADASRMEAGLLASVGSAETRTVADVPRFATIRFFFPQDEAAARDLASMLAATGVSWSVRDFTSYLPKPRPGTIEVWLPTR